MARKRKAKNSKNKLKTKKISPIIQENNNVISHIETKQPIIAPNGKTFYPCQCCSKIFCKETTYKTHMKKCLIKSSKQKSIKEECSKRFQKESIFNKSQNNSRNIINDSELNVNVPVSNPNIEKDSHHSTEDSDIEVQIIENDPPKYDLSIYDYDEDTTDEVPKNKDCCCKLCPFVAENPIELLRHKRNIHTIKKKIVSPNEIRKYVDYPDRSFCPLCEKPIKTNNYRSVFIKHLLVHTTGLTFECRICKKKFRRRDHLRCHEKRHVITFAELQAIQDKNNGQIV